MNIGEAIGACAFPVVHHFPGTDKLWAAECLFGSIESAVALIRAGPAPDCIANGWRVATASSIR